MMQDTRSFAEKAADLELSEVRVELMALGEELDSEGFTEREIVGCFCEALEEKLARLYCEHYEAGDMMRADGLGA